MSKILEFPFKKSISRFDKTQQSKALFDQFGEIFVLLLFAVLLLQLFVCVCVYVYVCVCVCVCVCDSLGDANICCGSLVKHFRGVAGILTSEQLGRRVENQRQRG